MKKLLGHILGVLPMSILAVAALTFWITGLWWVLPLGLAASGIVVLQNMSSHRQEGEDDEEDSGYDLTPLHLELRSKFHSILGERNKIQEELKERGADSFLNTEEISSHVNELVDGYYDLLLKLEKIRPFIDGASMAALNRSIEDLESQVEKCPDEVARENLSLALKNKSDQMKSLQELAKYEGRVNSQLENLVSALSSLYVRIVQIRLSPDSSLDPTNEIKESINSMLTDVRISEKLTQEFHRIVNENAL
jgi:hypothetical protein